MEIRAPAEQTEGTRSQVMRWLKSIGEPVAENEPLIEIETDKVTVEVPSPGTGVLREILKGEQEEITPGELLGRIEVGADQRASSASSTRTADIGAGVAAASATQDFAAAEAGTRATPGSDVGLGTQRLSPAVRRLLAEHELDPASIRGTGLGGRITVEDVLAAVAAGAGSGPASRAADSAVLNFARGAPAAAREHALADSSSLDPSSPEPALPQSSRQAPEGTSPDITGGSHRIPHTAVRKRIAEHMVHSLLHTAPHVTTVFEVDMTAVLAHREKHREEFARQGVPLTLTAYFLLAIVAAIRVVPEANSRWTDSALEVFDSIHIGVGTALEEGGLVVPVLRDAQSRDLFSTADGLNDLVTRAREGRLTPADVRGGTFTISNHGVSGSLLATPIVINQPQAAILGVGKLEKRPVVIEQGGEDRVVIQPRCYVTLTIDHRVMDGHQANRFMKKFAARLEDSWDGLPIRSR